VDNTILRLRKKLGSLGEAIETVWGIGYRLRPERQ
jgi:DNA-binding response OmpR family regulator